MNRLLIGFLCGLMLLQSQIVYAKRMAHYSVVIVRKLVDGEYIEAKAITRTRSAAKARKAEKARRKEFEAMGWEIVGKSITAGEIYDELFKDIFEEKRMGNSYLSLNDRKKNELRITFGVADGVTIIRSFNRMKEEYKYKKARDIRIIESLPKRYTHKQLGFSIVLPGSWAIKDKIAGGGPISIFVAPPDYQRDAFDENINIFKRDMRGLTLDEFVDVLNVQSAQTIGEYEVLYKSALEINNRLFVRILAKGRQGGIDLKFLGWYTQKENEAYVMSFIAEEEMFDTYYNEIEDAFESFRLIDNTSDEAV